MQELAIEMTAYTKWLSNLAKTNPEKARELALRNLRKTGMYDKDGNLVRH